MALRAAAAKSATVAAMSPAVISRGVGWSSMPSGVNSCSPDGTAEGATGTAPSRYRTGCPIRPQCTSCATIVPPSACTASVTRRHAATCSAVCSPGVWM